VEANFFSNHEELLEKCRYYRTHSEARSQIARAGHERCTSSDYSYDRQLYVLKRLNDHALRSAEEPVPILCVGPRILMHNQRLQLGTSRLEKLSRPARSVFIHESWVHLGDSPEPFLKHAAKVLLRRAPWFSDIRAMYQTTKFKEFSFRSGDRLPFERGSFTFVFSEHFFEHLPLSIALELFRECNRILNVGGVIRTVVPDAVLRTYEPPEPEGFPIHLPPGDPGKHKIRWTASLLSKAVEECGFRAIPLDYCTEDRTHIERVPEAIRAEYDQCVECADWPIVSDMSYIMRTPSLIVDAIKERETT
jgi:predicted SAM-dependent methyltransferase